MGTFKIAAPFVSAKEIGELKKAGADELYCGYVDSESERLWPIFFQTINRRLKGASFEGFEAFKEAVKEAESAKMPVYVTMNWHYTPEQYPWLLKTIRKISGLNGMHGLIVTDMGLLLTLKKMGYEKEIHISTGGTVFNNRTVEFFRSLGADRLILDRQLTTKEIADIILHKDKKTAIEIFLFNTACLFVDGYCAFFHCGGAAKDLGLSKDVSLIKYENTSIRQGCSEIMGVFADKSFKTHMISGKDEKSCNLKFQPEKYPFGCNLCGLYELKKFPGIILKIVERGVNQAEVIRGIKVLINYLSQKNIDKADYEKRARDLYFTINKNRCTPFKCYCPSVLIRE